ncbi:DUF6777 domain-containing protein [Streptomyces litmocidini]|uniref:DUF6777 domain-containing protein n=1 Tax=Streptomyces litmocidini TaxID=67318 RepID=UPI00167D1E01|nr:DUF6777 domain-containing protein [Streptomyces litmocidini]
MRSSPRRTRRTRPAVAGLVSALLLTGCSSAGEGVGGEPAPAPAQDVLLQPLGAHGPDPFTASTVRNTAPPAAPGRQPGDDGPRAHEVTGSTPGLYGGTRAIGSCDVERQVALLAADRTKARAFAEAAGIPEADVAGWLRGLTPVALRADTRVTDHGYREDRAHAFQAVLQTGTAVLVDQYGAPRVRCACGNPLRSPAAASGVHRGDPWDAFDPDRVITVRPTTSVVTSLVIVNTTDRTWIERRTGSDGDQDKEPAVEPDCDPDACALAGSGTPDPSTPRPRTPDHPASPDPDHPASPDPARPVPSAPLPDAPDPSGSGGTSTDPTAPTPPAPDPYTEPSPDPYTEPYPDPFGPFPSEPTAPDGTAPPDELFPAGPVPDRPEIFQG